ncbi:MAG: hypothetical protein Q7U91_00020 [Sideroxyarcus sp.]|nr:hypothetical protein [Sideroxyarcus sp.]
MFKAFRIFILLLILAGVALGASRSKTRSVEWKYDLPVNIYLINGDGSEAVAEHLRNLTVADFKPVERFMRDEAERYDRASRASIEVKLGGIIEAQPPTPPHNGSALDTILWSLQMRYWAYRNTDTDGPSTQVKMFLLYFDPAQHNLLDHSTGLQKGLLGRVNVFASREMARQNNVIITHEFLHTLGATDKYDLSTNLPLHPDGYAEPDRLPLTPQRFAEIMAGRTPVTQSVATIPESLNEVIIGDLTAREINWQQEPE